MSIVNQYLILFAVALVIAAPISYILIKLIFDFAYAYHMPVTYWTVAIGSVMLVLILLATVFTQVGKVVKANPVNGLKEE